MSPKTTPFFTAKNPLIHQKVGKGISFELQTHLSLMVYKSVLQTPYRLDKGVAMVYGSCMTGGKLDHVTIVVAQQIQ